MRRSKRILSKSIALGLTYLFTVGLSWVSAQQVVTKLLDTDDGVCDTDCSLREAIEASSSRDTITFQAGLSGVINTKSTLVVALDHLTINATGVDVVVSGQGVHQVFYHSGDNSSITFINLSVQYGNADVTLSGVISRSGGGVSSSGNVLLINSIFYGNRAAISGGGISATNNVILINSFIGKNESRFSGGGIYSNGSVYVISSTISKNSSKSSGGGISSLGNTRMVNSIINQNTAYTNGGGVFSWDGAFILYSTVSGNCAIRSGGGVVSVLNAFIFQSIVSGNNASKDGGGIFSLNDVNILSATVSKNTSGHHGSGIYARGAIEIIKSVFSNNGGSGSSAVYGEDIVTVKNSVINESNSIIVSNE